MRWTRSLIPTLRDDPADAEAISHKLMVRAGLVRQLAAGIYVYLPLGLRVLEKVNAIIREEMNGIGGQEIEMPVLHPAELWQQSGRWDVIGGEMFRLKDRNGRDMCLGMTHEEVIAWLAAREIRSYRDLPQIWYQIQTKERDEARPALGRAPHARVPDEGLLHPRSGRGRARGLLQRPQGGVLPHLRPLRGHLRGRAVGSRA